MAGIGQGKSLRTVANTGRVNPICGLRGLGDCGHPLKEAQKVLNSQLLFRSVRRGNDICLSRDDHSGIQVSKSSTLKGFRSGVGSRKLLSI